MYEKLHVINYCREQIHASHEVHTEMAQLQNKNIVLPTFQNPVHQIRIVSCMYLNVEYLKTHYLDVDAFVEKLDIICFAETHLSEKDEWPLHNIQKSEYHIIHNDTKTGGVTICVKKELQEELCQIYFADNILAYKFSGQQHFIVICIYQNPKINVHAFIDTLDHVLSKFKQLKLVIIGNFNENIYLKTSSAMLSYFASVGCQQKIKRPTTDSGTLIDHLYT